MRTCASEYGSPAFGDGNPDPDDNLTEGLASIASERVTISNTYIKLQSVRLSSVVVVIDSSMPLLLDSLDFRA